MSRVPVVRAYGIRVMRVVAGVLAVAAVGASCHADPGAHPRPPRPVSESTTRPRPVGPRVGSMRIGRKPVWTTPRPGQRFQSVRSVRVVGGALVYLGVTTKPTSTAERIVIADVATGHVRSAIDRGADLGHGVRADWPPHPSFRLRSVSVGDEPIVLIPYARGNQRGIAGVSGIDGGLRWTIPCGTFDGVEADDRTIAVYSGHGGALRVYDLRTHRALWQRSRVTEPFLLGRTILAGSDDSRGRAVMAYDRDTGRALWGRRYRDLRYAGTSRTMVAVGHAGKLLVLDARSGRELARAARPPDDGCADTSDPIGSPADLAGGPDADFLACPDPGDPTSQSVRYVERTSGGVEVSSRRAEHGFAAYDYRVWDGVLVGRDGYAFDSSGTPVPMVLPPGGTSIAAADGRYVVLFGGGRTDGLITLRVHVGQG